MGDDTDNNINWNLTERNQRRATRLTHTASDPETCVSYRVSAAKEFRFAMNCINISCIAGIEVRNDKDQNARNLTRVKASDPRHDKPLL